LFFKRQKNSNLRKKETKSIYFFNHSLKQAVWLLTEWSSELKKQNIIYRFVSINYYYFYYFRDCCEFYVYVFFSSSAL